MTRWLKIVGIGDDGVKGLGPAARAVVDQADVIVGGERQLAMVGDHEAECLSWPKPFDIMVEELRAGSGKNVCVLASGDPTCHGVGSLLADKLGVDAVQILPTPSAFSLACARLGWSSQTTHTLSLHGRPLELLHPFVQPNVRLLALSENAETPTRVAALLCDRGYQSSRLTVLSHMGGEYENIVSAQVDQWGPDQPVANLNTIAIECLASPEAPLVPRSPGLPDELFEHDGQLTKREVRAMTLSALSPTPGQLLWDIGAGCGSVSIEWMRSTPSCRAIAIESNPKRAQLIRSNATTLGTPDVDIVVGTAVPALTGLARPDAIFVGGGITQPRLFDECWRSLKPGGRLVANVISLEGEQILDQWQRTAGGQLTRIAVSRGETIGKFRCFKPLMAVTQFCAIKHEIQDGR